MSDPQLIVDCDSPAPTPMEGRILALCGFTDQPAVRTTTTFPNPLAHADSEVVS
jgi:hypothetical protein